MSREKKKGRGENAEKGFGVQGVRKQLPNY